jgi:hypothetical protein
MSNKSHNDGVVDLRITNLEEADKEIKTRVKVAEDGIVDIRFEIKDLKLIRQIVFGLVSLSLVTLFDKFFR